MGIDVFLFASRHLIVVCTQTCIFRCCIIFEAVVCRLYEMLYPCICNVVISCWKSGAYGFDICRGGTDMCFVLGFGRKRPNLKQYRISGLTNRVLEAATELRHVEDIVDLGEVRRQFQSVCHWSTSGKDTERAN